MISAVSRGLAGFALVVGLGACVSPSYEIVPATSLVSRPDRALWDASKLSDSSFKSLEADHLLALYQSDPSAAIERSWQIQKNSPVESRLAALLEMCVDQGDLHSEERPIVALGHYLDGAKIGRDYLSSEIRTLHRRALSGVVEMARVLSLSSKESTSVSGVLEQHRLKIATGKRYLGPNQCSLLVPAERLVLKGLELRKVSQEGAGLAMVGREVLSEDRLRKNPFVSKGGYCYSINARVDFSGNEATLVLQDLMLGSFAKIGGKSVPLAADFTAAIACYFDERKAEYSGLMAMIRPGEYESREGLYTIEPFREDKIPLILVHGLQSKAMAWVHLANRLRADPMVRERYQIVLFSYPTGAPVAHNAADLRDALSEFQRFHDPKRTNPYFKRSVIVGHSMGGVISNMQIRDSGSQLYDTLFDEELDELTLDKEKKDEVRRRMFFESNPDIRRAVLIAAPLRGTEFASNVIGRLGASLIRLPFELTESVLNEIQNLDVFRTRKTKELFAQPRNSITSLETDDPVLLAALSLPVRKGVKIHSIIAQANEDAPTADGTDRVVPYSSAHLEGVESEKVVLDANHTSILRDDECLVELWRILREHLKDAPK